MALQTRKELVVFQLRMYHKQLLIDSGLPTDKTLEKHTLKELEIVYKKVD